MAKDGIELSGEGGWLYDIPRCEGFLLDFDLETQANGLSSYVNRLAHG